MNQSNNNLSYMYNSSSDYDYVNAHALNMYLLEKSAAIDPSINQPPRTVTRQQPYQFQTQVNPNQNNFRNPYTAQSGRVDRSMFRTGAGSTRSKYLPRNPSPGTQLAIRPNTALTPTTPFSTPATTSFSPPAATHASLSTNVRPTSAGPNPLALRPDRPPATTGQLTPRSSGGASAMRPADVISVRDVNTGSTGGTNAATASRGARTARGLGSLWRGVRATTPVGLLSLAASTPFASRQFSRAGDFAGQMMFGTGIDADGRTIRPSIPEAMRNAGSAYQAPRPHIPERRRVGRNSGGISRRDARRNLETTPIIDNETTPQTTAVEQKATMDGQNAIANSINSGGPVNPWAERVPTLRERMDAARQQQPAPQPQPEPRIDQHGLQHVKGTDPRVPEAVPHPSFDSTFIDASGQAWGIPTGGNYANRVRISNDDLDTHEIQNRVEMQSTPGGTAVMRTHSGEESGRALMPAQRAGLS